jgi:serine/threonine protein kinase
LLRSPAVVTTYDIGEDNGTLFIVMELVEGEALADRLRRGPLSIHQTLGMTLQIADALDEAHGLGIIHRDIKPANLVLEANGRVKILAFGLAKFTGPAVELGSAETMAQTSLGVVVGTVSYMSPEQALGRPVDTRSDLFSLGIVVYESLTGRLPFEGETTTAVIDTLIHAEPPPVVAAELRGAPAARGRGPQAAAEGPRRTVSVSARAAGRSPGDPSGSRSRGGIGPRRVGVRSGRGCAAGRATGPDERGGGDPVHQHHPRAGRRLDRLRHRRNGHRRPQEHQGAVAHRP